MSIYNFRQKSNLIKFWKTFYDDTQYENIDLIFTVVINLHYLWIVKMTVRKVISIPNRSFAQEKVISNPMNRSCAISKKSVTNQS